MPPPNRLQSVNDGILLFVIRCKRFPINTLNKLLDLVDVIQDVGEKMFMGSLGFHVTRITS